MPDLTDTQLDERIRELVGRVADGAPPPPSIDGAATASGSSDARRPNPLLLAAAAAALVAIIAGAVVLTRDDNGSVGPATNPTSPGLSVDPTSGTPLVDVTDIQPLIAVATEDGVSARDPRTGKEVAAISSDELVMEYPTLAVATGDGRVVVTDDTDITVWNTSTGEDERFFPPGASLSGWPRLHDVAVVDGRVWILFTIRDCCGEDKGVETAYVQPLDGDISETREVDVVAQLEDTRTSRLSLGANGVVVGTYIGTKRMEPIVLAVPDTPAAELLGSSTPDDLGLPYSNDCSACATAFAISSDGDTVAWMEGTELVRRALWDPEADGPRTDVGRDAWHGYVDLLPDGSVLIVPDQFATSDAPPRRVTADGSLMEEYGLVLAVTEGPSLPADLQPDIPPATVPDPPPVPLGTGQVAAPATPPSMPPVATTGPYVTDPEPITTPPTTTTLVNPDDVEPLITVVTPDGVSARDPSTGEEIARFDAGVLPNPPRRAVAVGDDRVVVGVEDTIWIWHTETGEFGGFFSPTADLIGVPRLHDVAVIDRRVWVLYSLRSLRGENAGKQWLFAGPLDGDPMEVREVGVIAPDEDASTSILSLGSNGAVVGTSTSATGAELPMVLAVPGTPAADLLGARSAADLALPPFTECFMCPTTFAVSADGQTVAWGGDGGSELATRALWDPDATVNSVDIGIDIVGGDIDLLPDGSALIVPDPRLDPAAGVPRLVAADGSLIEEYRGAFSVSEGPSVP